MSSGEKTELPTSKKLRDARQKGQVAQSKDVGSTSLLLALFTLLLTRGDWMFQHCQELIVLPAAYYDVPFEDALPEVVGGVVKELLVLTLPVLGVAVVIGVMINFLQVGPLFVLEPVKPDFKKLDPADRLKQIFSMKNLMEFIKSVLKVLFLGVLLYYVIKDSIPALIRIPYGGLEGAVSVLGDVLFVVAVSTTMVYIAIAGADFAFQRRQHTKQLMMTKDEVKREYKEMEGDPTIKSKRKQLHQEMAMSNTVANVRKSTVLVTNPTQRAVAIYYKKGETKLPVITAMGEGTLARRMIEVAREEGIPIMQNVPLALELLEHGQIEQYIPTELIEPIAEVLRVVQQLADSEQ